MRPTVARLFAAPLLAAALVECVARDDDVCVDACKPGDLSCRSWTDDCTELFLDGAFDRLTDSRADGGKHLAHGGERDHTLYWMGSHYLPFRNESAFGEIVFADAPAGHAAKAPPPAVPATHTAVAAFVLATDYAAADGVTDAADSLQRCIDENPKRTICFPDGVYLLSHPICTPADPARTVSLRLSDFAILKAAPGWAHTNAMVRLGGIHPANNNRSPTSGYGLYGGVIDGAGVANAISIESGRETRVQNVNVCGARVGVHVLRGANSGSADCDIRDVDMTGNNAPDSIGLLVEAHDNSFTNIRCVDFATGVRLRGSGNFLANIHPLLSRVSNQRFFDDTVGFDDNSSNNSYLHCYSDQFSTGWLFGPKSDNADLDGCIAYWYDSDPGKRHTVLRCEGPFQALVDDLWAGFRDTKATNAVLLAGEEGGHGVIRDIRLVESLINAHDDRFRARLTGRIHP